MRYPSDFQEDSDAEEDEGVDAHERNNLDLHTMDVDEGEEGNDDGLNVQVSIIARSKRAVCRGHARCARSLPTGMI